MSPQECQIARCSPNQLEMMTSSPVLASEQSPIPHHTGQLAWLPLGNSRDSLRHPSQVYRNTIQHRNSRKAPCTPYHLEKRADSQDSIKEVGHLPTSTSRGAFPQQSLCDRDPEFAASCSGYRDSLTRKTVGFPCSGLNAGPSFISQYKGTCEYFVQTLEKALGHSLI